MSKIEKLGTNLGTMGNDIPHVKATEIVEPTVIARPKPWASLFQQNRVATHGMALRYIPLQNVDGHAVIQLELQDVEEEEPTSLEVIQGTMQ